MKNNLKGALSVILFLVLSIQCTPGAGVPENTGQLIAEVGSRKLFARELEQIIHPNTSPGDSTSLANAYIDQWVRDNLLMQEASRVYSADFELEKLVEDYREKLLKFKLEEKIIHERYDTIVTEQQLLNFYSANKENFLLQQSIYRCWRAEFSNASKDKAGFRQAWNNEDVPLINSWINSHSGFSTAGTYAWYTWEEIQEWCPLFVEKGAANVKNQRKIKDNVEFYLKVLEVVDKGDFSPLEYIKYQLKLMILHKRKQDIIDNYKRELYERALESNVVKIY